MHDPKKALIKFLNSKDLLNNLPTQLNMLYEKFLELEKNEFNRAFFNSGDYMIWLAEELQCV